MELAELPGQSVGAITVTDNPLSPTSKIREIEVLDDETTKKVSPKAAGSENEVRRTVPRLTSTKRKKSR